MLSQITSRLMMGSSSNTSNGSSSRGSNNNNNNNREKPTFSSSGAARATSFGKPSYSTSLHESGYSADGSSSAVAAAAARTAPPDYIDFLERNGIYGNKDSSTSTSTSKNNKNNKSRDDNDDDNTSGQSRSNRRKAMELSFTASRAMEDLKKGGLPIPTIRTEDARNLEGHKIDVSKVELVMAKSVKESPFLIDNHYNTTREIMRVLPDISCEYSSLFAATYHSYENSTATTTTSTTGTGTQWGGDSSTSSVTSSESDDAASMPPPASVVPPLLEDALRANEEAMKNAATDAAAKGLTGGSNKRKRPMSSDVIAAKAAKLHHITMNDALEASNEARVVTLSFHPFIVVHVNTAYTRLTGYSSAKVLGRPLQDCLSGSCSKDWMKIRGVAHPVAALHERVTPIRTKANKKHHQQCKCQAILVGQQLDGKKEVDTSSVTHYAVSFLPITANSSSSSTNNPTTTTTTTNTDGSSSVATAKTTTVTTTTTSLARAPGDRPQQVMG